MNWKTKYAKGLGRLGMKYERTFHQLANVIDLIGGGTPKTSVSEYWDGNIPWISVKDFNNDDRYVCTTEKSITQAGLNNSSTKLLAHDDIIISARGTVGELAMIPFPMAFNQSCYGIRGKKDIIIQPYLYYLLKDSVRLLKSQTHGSVFDTITRETFANIKISLPSILEQQIISDTLSALDDKITINKKINHHLEQIAQAVFKSWFVDFEPWGGVMPDDWREVELGNVVTLSAGGDKPVLCSSTPTNECSIPVFSNGIDNFGLYGYTDIPKVTEECVTVSARGTIGFVCLRQEPFVPIVRLITAIPNKEFITAKYLYLYINSIHIAGVGTTQQQLTVPDFKKYRILVPSFDVVNNFTETVAPMLDTIRHKRWENARLMAVRDTLLPRLMSGELSVADLTVK